VADIVIAAHNEGRAIDPALSRLAPLTVAGDVRLIVVARGSSNGAAELASSLGPAVRVLSISAASKQEALRTGDEAASGFPRVYLDADVDLGAKDLRALIAEVTKPGVLAAAPRLVMDTNGSSWPMRWYYEVYLQLPEVRRGLVGRGVIAVSEAGYERLARYAPSLGFDLAAYRAFAPAERRVVEGATARRKPPKTVAALLAGSVSAAVTLAKFERERGLWPSRAWTRPADLAGIIWADPARTLKVGWFIVTMIVAKLSARVAVARYMWRAYGGRQAA
jgi:glycosyltransferase involved in cell wall biosynthesis